MKDIAKTFSRKNLPDSEVELSGELPYETVAPYEKPALSHLLEHLELPGFRKGKVPEEMARKRLGDTKILEEAVELLLQDLYPELVAENKLDVVGRPAVNITKLAPKNPVGLTIRIALYPEVSLPKNFTDLHKDIAQEQTAPATDEEVEKTIENIRQSRTQGEVVPELTDEFAKSLGAFENVEALKAQIKKGIAEEKERAAKDARRSKIIDTLLEKTKIEIPRIFVESELEKIMGQLKDDVSRFGLKYEDYLKQIKKTEEEMRNDFREQAKKRAKLQLTLNKIAEVEKVEADKEAVEHEMKHALEHFPQAKPELLRIHIESVLRNEKVLKLLEGEK